MPETEKTFAERIDAYRAEGIRRVKLAFCDVDGVHRGKYLDLEKFASLGNGTAGFCDCVLGWDIDDQLYDNIKFTGWHTGFPDASYRVDLSTERRMPDEDDTPLFLIDFVPPEGSDSHPICPRNVLNNVLRHAEELGFGVKFAFEYEFFIFAETPHSIREKNYHDLTPLSPGNFGYSVLRNSALSDLFNELMDYSHAMDFPLEGLHCETGPGVWEGAIGVTQGLAAADRAALFKTFSKVFFQKRGLTATFMAKWSMDYPGQSGHMHQSLVDLSSGRNVFFDAANPLHMSDTMRHYLGGLQQYTRPFLAMIAPTINSYTRLVKGAWAPTTATWGSDNRTTALRLIGGSEKAQRLEHRVAPADANPYLAAAAAIGAGLLGIEQRLEPTAPIKGNAYDQEHRLQRRLHLHSNLRDAAADFAKSKQARSLFGDSFVDHYAASRMWEVREYERFVNDWQLKRYFEVI